MGSKASARLDWLAFADWQQDQAHSRQGEINKMEHSLLHILSCSRLLFRNSSFVVLCLSMSQTMCFFSAPFSFGLLFPLIFLFLSIFVVPFLLLLLLLLLLLRLLLLLLLLLQFKIAGKSRLGFVSNAYLLKRVYTEPMPVPQQMYLYTSSASSCPSPLIEYREAF